MKQRNALALAGLLLMSLLPVIGLAGVGDKLEDGSTVIWEGTHETGNWSNALTIDEIGDLTPGSVITVEFSTDGQIQLLLYGQGTGENSGSDDWYSIHLTDNEYDDYNAVTSGEKWTYTVTGENVEFSSQKKYGTSKETDRSMIKNHGIQIAGNGLTITRVSVKKIVPINSKVLWSDGWSEPQ